MLLMSLQTYGVEKLILTPPQTEGPFYPGRDLMRTRNSVLNHKGLAYGELIKISGEVVDENNRPISEAEVHLWQTDGFMGRYINDQTDLPLDENFNYFGSQKVNFIGEFSFISVRPIEYKADENWTRPQHLHFKILWRNKEILTTQTYFEGDPWIEKDLILNRLTPEQRASVIVKYVPGDIVICRPFFDQDCDRGKNHRVIRKPGEIGHLKFVINSDLLIR